MRTQSFRKIAVFALLGFIWGSEWVTSRAIDAPPLISLAFRYGVAATILALIVGFRRIPLPTPSRAVIAAMTGVTLLAVPTILLAWATSRVSPGLLVVLLAMTPLIAALLEGQASRVSLTPLLAPLIGGVTGTALIASHALSFSGIQWAGAATVLASAILVAVSIAFIKRKLFDLPPLAIAAVQFPVAAVAVWLASLQFEPHANLDFSGQAVKVEVGLAVFANVLAFPLYYWLLKSMESFQLTASQWLITVIGLVEGLLIVRVAPNWRIVAGIVIIIASLWSLFAIQPGDDTPSKPRLNLQVTPPN